ncbi:MAG: hypothetical protein IPK75_10115 [Acidobacteria bacterium]|nr:hypothetical protein [Acidobacteriota bacterium]
MIRFPAALAALAALASLGGCQTWKDQADAEALAACARIADPDKRETCQTEVMTAYGDAERDRARKQSEAQQAAEDREALRKAYGIPKRAVQ